MNKQTFRHFVDVVEKSFSILEQFRQPAFLVYKRASDDTSVNKKRCEIVSTLEPTIVSFEFWTGQFLLINYIAIRVCRRNVNDYGNKELLY